MGEGRQAVSTAMPAEAGDLMDSRTGELVVDRAEVAARLAVAVGRINRRIRPWGHGLSLGLLSALSSVVRDGPVRPSDLARSEAVAAPTLTRLIAELEHRGFLTRRPDPADGRSYLVEATSAGAEAVLQARADRADHVAALLAVLSDDELVSVAAALPALEATATAGLL
jgi:DNA-binding MarR family transcriptional regulator